MRALFLLIALSILSALPAWATDVLIVQSGRSSAYTEAVRGFTESYKGSTQKVVLADYVEVDVVRLVKEEQPRLVLAVGDKALESCRTVRQVPVVSLMALSYGLAREPAGTASGVSMLPSPERYLEQFRALGVKRVGVVHDPAKTGYYLKRVRQLAQQLGIQLVVQEVRSPREVSGRLEQLKGQADALWMLPDTTAVTAETIEAWFNFSASMKLPLVTFSEQYLAKGALAALEINRTELGRQAAELANSILASGARTKPQDARKVQLRTNTALASRLGVALPTPAQ
jgi:putative tryptophan/tyrosine transport system substrate-binding protein